MIVDATTAKMQETGSPDQYMLYLRAYSNDLLFQAGGEEALREAGLADYQQVIDLGGTYAQSDYDKLTAMEIKAEPLSWQVPQMLTLQEAAAALGMAADDLLLGTVGYSTADGGKTGAGYALRTANDPAASMIYVLTDLHGGQERFNVVKSMAVMQLTLPLDGIGDEAVMMGLRNTDDNPALYTVILVRKEELVLQIRVPYAFWSSEPYHMNPASTGMALAETLLSNLYDTQRAVPGMDGIVFDNMAKRVDWRVSDADSPVPDTMPTDLAGKTEYGYLVEMRAAYLPASVYENADLPENDLNNARRAARLIANSITRRFDAYGQNPYELEIRAACYKFAYQDTGDEVFRKLAINDYKQALYTGYSLGKRDYDALATPLLSSMAEMSLGTSGDAVTRLQQLADPDQLHGYARDGDLR